MDRPRRSTEQSAAMRMTTKRMDKHFRDALRLIECICIRDALDGGEIFPFVNATAAHKDITEKRRRRRRGRARGRIR